MLLIRHDVHVGVISVVLLSVGFSALVAALWCIGACRCQRGMVRSRADAPWKQLPSTDNFPLCHDGSKPLLDDDEEDGLEQVL